MNKTQFFEPPKEGEPWDVAIIGSGPAALTAAVYTTRGAASTLVLAGSNWGGQLMLTTEVDNFPGFPEGIQGPELMQRMKDQAERFGARMIYENVKNIDLEQRPFSLETDSEHYRSSSVILATGSQTKWLGVEGEERLRGRGVSSCAPCDAPFFKDKNVFVVGGGDSAMEESLVLAKYASKVTIVHRRDALSASAAMQKKVLESDIRIIWDTEVEEMIGESKLESLKLKTRRESEQAKDLPGERLGDDENFIYWNAQADGVFVAIGHVPSTEFLKGSIELDEKGYVKAQKKDGFGMRTSVGGVFVAGDVHDYHYRQAITAAGFGCQAAMETLKFLDKSAPNY